MTNAAVKWDTSKLTAVPADLCVYRAINDNHIQGWNETEQRWDILPSAMDTKSLGPSDAAGHGLSVYIDEYLYTHCGAPAGTEVFFLQGHAAQHQNCAPTWQDGIIVKVRVSELLALRFGVGSSPGDATCTTLAPAHASVWRGPGWTKPDRAAALKLMGSSFVYEHPTREQERLAARTSVSAPRPKPSASAAPNAHKPTP